MRTIWTLKLTESWGEVKSYSKRGLERVTRPSFLSLPIAFMMAAAINVPLGRAFVKKLKKTKNKKKKTKRLAALQSKVRASICA